MNKFLDKSFGKVVAVVVHWQSSVHWSQVQALPCWSPTFMYIDGLHMLTLRERLILISKAFYRRRFNLLKISSTKLGRFSKIILEQKGTSSLLLTAVSWVISSDHCQSPTDKWFLPVQATGIWIHLVPLARLTLSHTIIHSISLSFSVR